MITFIRNPTDGFFLGPSCNAVEGPRFWPADPADVVASAPSALSVIAGEGEREEMLREWNGDGSLIYERDAGKGAEIISFV